MNAEVVIEKEPGQTTQNELLSDSSVLADAQSLWCELGGLSVDRLRLAGLETQRAALATCGLGTERYP